MNLYIRKAKLSDAPRIADIHIRSWIFAYSDSVPMAIIENQNSKRHVMWWNMLANNVDSTYVICENNDIVGFLSINTPRENFSDDIYELSGLYLDPEYIGNGFGRFAMEWIKKEVKSRGYKGIYLWVLDTNYKAKKFYKKSGFKPDGGVKPSGLGDTKEERYIINFD